MWQLNRETVLRLAPRALGILFAGFLGIFALDAWSEGATVGEALLALGMHLIPSAVVLAVVLASWRRAWGWIGGLSFLALGVWYVATAWGRFPLSTYAAIAGPMFLLGLLFASDWWGSRRVQGVRG